MEFTTKDHNGLFSLVLYTSLCNMKCYWCHNKKLNTIRERDENYKKLEYEDIEMAISNNIVDMIILCWGEFLINPIEEIIITINEIRKLNNKALIRIDTNWTSPEKVKKLISLWLIDWLWIDIKWPYWERKQRDNINKIIWIKWEDYFDKIIETIHLWKELPHTIYRTVKYPIIKDEEYFTEIERYIKENIKKPYLLNNYIKINE